ncbi:DNA cytosine methyltransferase [Paenibacillus sp. GYB004]|uniref:DNA cytosine methyltransferase n=1 Tax=Paenibacillus sp. GYB004 TaxID=2994393 RepID=UPI002F96AEF6
MKTEWTAAILFGGIGGATAGLEGARGEYAGHVGQYKILCSIDVDPVACHNHDLITGTETAVQMDLFDRKQYVDFFGKQPPESWQEATTADMWQAFQEQVPDTLFTSPPCKGFSGLLPEKSAKTSKYQALNRLTIRGLKLALDTCLEYGDDLPRVILMENVPRIKSRGKKILDEIKYLLKGYGFAVHDADHDCGELGGLGQHRKRYLLIARNERKMNSFVYRPAIKPLKTIGQVLGRLPMPGDTVNGGPLHRLPRLEWKTWVRLALIPAGGDWRDLNKVDWENYRIVHEPRRGAFEVAPWEEPTRAVTSTAGPGRSNGVTAVSDPRLEINGDGKTNLYRIQRDDEPAACITGAVGPSNGAACINDPRLKEREGRHPGVYRIIRTDEPAACITGTRFGSGAIAIADPRVNTELMPDSYGIQDWDNSAKTVRSASRIMQSASSIADPRLNDRDGQRRSNGYPVRSWDGQAYTITGEDSLGSGGQSISDPRISDRPGRYTDQYRMQSTDAPAATVTGVTDVQSGAQLIADARLGCEPRSGTYGVQSWEEPAKTVTASGDVHSGTAAIADPRPVPEDADRGVWTIIAEDGTWHRPLTTYELAMLQDFPVTLPDGRPFQLEQCADAKAREYIGNAVPRAAAAAMGSVILTAMMASYIGDFHMDWAEVWVAPEDEHRSPAVLH